MDNSLKAFKPTFLDDLTRVGNAFDGGYLVNARAICNTRHLLSFGVCEDWLFEADFLGRKPDVGILSFDNSVSKDLFRKRRLNALSEIFSARFAWQVLSLNVRGVRRRLSAVKHESRLYFRFSSFFSGENIRFFPKGVSNERSRQFATLEDVFRMIPQDDLCGNSVFIKMDIEQSEFRVLPDVLKFQEFVNGMVVEFHDLDILWPVFVDLMERLKAYFEVTHIHGNNFGGLIPGSTTPRTLEVTFLKKDLIQEERLTSQPAAYPIPELDRPNDRSEKDYPLYF